MDRVGSIFCQIQTDFRDISQVPSSCQNSRRSVQGLALSGGGDLKLGWQICRALRNVSLMSDSVSRDADVVRYRDVRRKHFKAPAIIELTAADHRPPTSFCFDWHMSSQPSFLPLLYPQRVSDSIALGRWDLAGSSKVRRSLTNEIAPIQITAITAVH